MDEHGNPLNPNDGDIEEDKDEHEGVNTDKDEKDTETKKQIKMAEYFEPSPAERAWSRMKVKEYQSEIAREAIEKAVQQYTTGDSSNAQSSSGTGQIDPAKFIRTEKMSNKLLNRISKFSGEDDLTWDDFLLKIQIASLNQSFDEGELKVVLFQALEGKAQKYLAAHQELLDMPYVAVLDHLGEVYRKPKESNVSALQTLTQGPQESVHDFAARVLNTAGTLCPQEPSLIKIKVEPDTGNRIPVPNPMLEEEKAIYKGQLEQLEIFMRTFFLQGLRPEIRQTMKAEEYKSYRTLEKAAVEAEKLVIASGIKMCGNLRSAEKMQLKNLEKDDKRNVKCYRCHKRGHISKDCYSKTDDKGNFLTDGAQAQKPKNTKSKGNKSKSSNMTETKNKKPEHSPEEDYETILAKKVTEAVISNLRYENRRGRSRERGQYDTRRSGSREYNQKRNRSSSGGYRSGSGNYREYSGYRSSSRDRYRNNSGNRYRSNSGNRYRSTSRDKRYVNFTDNGKSKN